ncbi:MAG: hypothetical protein QGD94_00200 [Planctomycetia bacterium]|nr:hypothetical protein [Planctomycetia bacterium]
MTSTTSRKLRPTAELERKLGVVNSRRTILRLVGGVSLVVAVAAGAVVLLGVIGATIRPGAPARCLLLVLSTGAVSFVLIHHLVRMSLRHFTHRSAAVTVEKHFGGMRNNLVSAIGVWKGSLWHRSPAFAAALAQTAESQCRALRFSKAVSSGPAIKALGLGILGLALVAALLVANPAAAQRELSSYLAAPHDFWTILNARNIEMAFEKADQVVLRGTPSAVKLTLEMKGRGLSKLHEFYVREEGKGEWTRQTLSPIVARGTTFVYKVQETDISYECKARIGEKVSPIASVRAVDRPKVVTMWLEYAYPKYLEVAPVRIKVSNGDIRAIFGTFVSVMVETNVDLKDAHLVANGETKPMRLRETRYAVGKLRVERNGEYRLELTSTDGFDNLPISFKMSVRRDALPTVRIVNCPEDDLIEVDSMWSKSVEVEAKDAEGIRQLDIEYHLRQMSGKAYRELALDGFTGLVFYDPARQSVADVIGGLFEDLPIELGDQITFRARAIDSCTVDDGEGPPEPHVVFSKTYKVSFVLSDFGRLGPLGPGDAPWDEEEPGKSAGGLASLWPTIKIIVTGVPPDAPVLRSVGHEPALPVKKHSPGVTSSDFVPTGDTGDIIVFRGG